MRWIKKKTKNKDISVKEIIKILFALFIVITFLYYTLPIFIGEAIYLISSYMHFVPNIDNLFIDTFRCCENKYVTGRNITSYNKHFFPGVSRNKMIQTLLSKRYLDVGSGLNHTIPNSLISILKDKGSRYAKGMDIVEQKHSPIYINASIMKTGLRSNSIDMMTSQYVLYSHIKTIPTLKRAFKEIHRILKKNGEIRVYPIYYSNYYMGDKGLKRYIDNLFDIEIIEPKFYIDKNKTLLHKGKLENLGDSYLMEWARHKILQAKTIIFKKK